MTKAEAKFTPYPEAHVEFSINMPVKALAALEQIAHHRQKSCQGLVKEYLSAGLMADGANMFRETAMRIVDEVVARHLPEAEAKAILKEIRDEMRPAHMRDEFKPRRPTPDPTPVVEES